MKNVSLYEEEPNNSIGWLRENSSISLEESYRSIKIPQVNWRKAFAFAGPGYLVSVGYMDPGNWATSLSGGSKFGYTLLIAIFLSSIMAIILQALSARLAIATNRDLAQACRDAYPLPCVYILWFLAELAIIATDIAEVIGTAIGLNLIFNIPIELGTLLTIFDVFLILYLQKLGFRWVESLIIIFLTIIATCFAAQIFLADPVWKEVVSGFFPTTDIIKNPEMLYLCLGILGATVMPHNLYLHSGLVQTRDYGNTIPEKKSALNFAIFDSTFALVFAFFINASILVLAGATFHKHGRTEIGEIHEAWSLLETILDTPIAPTLFGIALLLCGLSSTITATLAGQIVMEGFLNIKLRPWLRRFITRFITIVPASFITIFYGETGTSKLLIFSQVVLSLQLSFAVFPLVFFTSSQKKMGSLKAPILLSIAGITIAILIGALNLTFIFNMLFP